MLEYNLTGSATSAAIILAAALIHASFQTGVSVLTLLSGHAFGNKASHQRVLKLGFFYVLGILTMTLLVGGMLLQLLAELPSPTERLWQIVSVVGLVIGAIVMVFYYRLRRNLVWLPKPIAAYLESRTKRTKISAEAYGLGLMTAIAELPFLLVPLVIVVLVIQTTSPATATLMYGSYALLSAVPLLAILAFIGAGKPVSRIERWRENNKGFLQFASGALLIVVSAYLLVTFCLGGGSKSLW